jgi:hypothetical protein
MRGFEMNNKGCTLVKMMIVIAMIGIALAVYAASTGTIKTNEASLHGGTICKGGMLFNVDGRSNQQQIIGPDRAGVPCR